MWRAVLACVVAATATVAAQPTLLGGMCPMVTQGAQVSEIDTPDGAALDFTIAGDPTLLRARVHQLAAAQNQAPAGRMAVVGQGSAAREVPVIAAHAEAQDTSTGARLLLSAADPAQIGELRQQLRDKVVACTKR